MVHNALSGHIEVVCGSMFSGKTEELVRRLKRMMIARQKVQVFKPTIDNRYSTEHVQSHDASRLASRSVENALQILEYVDDNTQVVGIDEAQFFDESIVEVAQKLAYRGKRVIVAGLDMDFRGQPFGPMPQLLSVAENVTKLSAVCVVCGGVASRTQRVHQKVEGKVPAAHASQVVVGAQEMYEARCRFCHEPHSINPENTRTTGVMHDAHA
ncbi:MAG: thymidine kinase [Bacteriovoracia bacterium]